MQIKVLNQKGKEAEEKLTLDKSVWDLPNNVDLITQALYVFNSNKRRGTAHAKGRGDVSGGGRKPWRQKGTGRARAGSSRSPVWIKGGVTFAPNDRNWDKKLNDKMKRKAIAVALSSRLKNEEIKFVKFSSKGENKDLRKDVTNLVGKLKTLVISDQEEVLRTVRNLENFKIAKPLNLNIYESLSSRILIIDSNAVEIIEKRLKNEK